MTAWVLRATVLGALVVGLRLLLGFAMAFAPTFGLVWRVACLIVIVGVAAVWGMRDGRSAVAVDLTVRWMAAGAVAGLASGAVCLVLDQIPGVELGDSGALFELTSSAAFIMLLIFLPALAGVAFGRRRARRAPESAAPATQPEFATA
ncbi:B-4DMT family transporter [Nocardia neocaledoniensis]|uniref:B-4DMT family transporter n=1 Tax=Nocardia neocaledoniensis TaxID=236511 RepID=UPI0024555AED|nr:B-4DMT family transporter [Nocardia neocaledoniensis]